MILGLNLSGSFYGTAYVKTESIQMRFVCTLGQQNGIKWKYRDTNRIHSSNLYVLR